MTASQLSRIRFGAAYYPEYSPYPRLKKDLDLMAAARFTVIRVGESVWSTWEPQDGVFHLEWLQPVLDGAHDRGIEVILGTPTYAIPSWMRRKHPEVMAERDTGRPIPFGHRQNADYSHPAFRHYAARVVHQIVGRYSEHPAVIGYQVDNEPGAELIHNRGAFEGFVDHLREVYGDVEALNERWGLTYWSHRISRWSELWTPDGNTTPAYDLAWRRYQAHLTNDFIHWQADLVRELARDDQFVMTCIALGRPAQDVVALGNGLDLTATNLYYPMQDGLALPSPDHDTVVGRPQWLRDSGTWSLYLQSDTSRGVRQEPFLVTETDASSIGEAHVNFGAYDGQWRQAIWSMVSRGARMVEYWHWHSNHFGNETYWGGVLGHSLEPGRCYDELARSGAELKHAEELLAGYLPDEEVAFLVSPASRWALEFQPPLSVEGTNDPDRSSYDRILGAIYRGFFEARVQCAIVHPDQLGTDVDVLVDRWPVLIVPALYVASDELLELLAAYAEAGGHLVLTFRSGYADLDARPRPVVMPGILTAAAGTSYLEYSNITEPVPVRGGDGELMVADGYGTGWADGLRLEGATALASYDHPHLGRWPAITTNAHGSGRVTYLGTLPDATLARGLARWVTATSLPDDAWRDSEPSVTVTSGRTMQGRLRFISNWSWEPCSFDLPGSAQDVLTGTTLDAGTSLELGAWDVKVLLERNG